tara:strand:+ start:341 stop:916 length:576 start_codon:yes stop_codon:yes gene_type:complete
MKILLILFVLFFSSSVFADDISDFQIEGMSVGDSLLSYYDEEIIINSKIDYFVNERQYYVVGIYDNLKIYDAVEIYLKTNDKSYEIKTITGKLIINNKKQCLDMKDDLTADIANLFENKKQHDEIKNHDYDNSGKSKQHLSQFNIDGFLTHVRVECSFFSKKIKKDLNYDDSLNVVAMDEEISEWILDGYR